MVNNNERALQLLGLVGNMERQVPTGRIRLSTTATSPAVWCAALPKCSPCCLVKKDSLLSQVSGDGLEGAADQFCLCFEESKLEITCCQQKAEARAEAECRGKAGLCWTPSSRWLRVHKRISQTLETTAFLSEQCPKAVRGDNHSPSVLPAVVQRALWVG